MDRIFPKIYLDFSSLILGAVVIAALFILYFVFRRRLKTSLNKISKGFINFRDNLSISSDADYIKVVYRYAESLHILSDHFSLDAILVPAKIIAPPPPIEPGGKSLDPSLIQQSFGYDPALPELSSEFFGPTFTLLEALSTDANLCLVGFPGTGKTTAIAECIISLSRAEKTEDDESEQEPKIPFYVKAHHILAQFPGSDIPEILLAAIQSNKVFLTAPNFSRYFASTINQGNGVLFIDDMDLLSRTDLSRLVNFIGALVHKIPSLQIVATGSPTNLESQAKSDLELITIYPWGNSEKYTFLNKFARAWEDTQVDSELQVADRSAIKNSMLVVSDRFSTPLEFTLKSFSAYAGDITGPSSIRSIESYLKRHLLSVSKEALRAMEAIALHLLTEQKSDFSRKDLQDWLVNVTGDQSYNLADDKIAPLTSVIQTAIDQGVLQQSSANNYYFTYSTFAGFFAARALVRSSATTIRQLLEGPNWPLVRETMRFFPAYNNIKPHFPLLAADSTLLKERLVRSSLWLQNMPQESPDELELIKLITKEVQTNHIYMIKARLVAALAKSKNKNIKNIFQHLMNAEHQDTRRAASIGAGLISDLSAVPALIQQLNDLYPSSTTACYCLGRIASPRSLEAIADALLHGDERLRRSAAESLALNRSEGHPALREGIQMEDLLVRYAVVHGLSLIQESWAVEILEKMRIDEDEWVVRDLAQQHYEAHELGSPYLPTPLPAPDEAAWLNKYADNQDLPKANPQNALELLLHVLSNGSAEQKQAALFYLAKIGSVEQIPTFLDYVQNPDPDISQTATLNIWYCAPPSYSLPVSE